jgi:hypothetical protein
LIHHREHGGGEGREHRGKKESRKKVGEKEKGEESGKH